MNRLPFDRIITFTVLSLIIIGLVNLYSASYYFDKSIFLKQAIWVIIGFTIMITLFFTKYETMINSSLIIYVFFTLLTILTIFIGREIRGTKSWLNILGMGIQPSEFLKVGVLLLATKYLTIEGVDPKKFSTFVIVSLIFLGPVGIIMLQPDLGMAISYFLLFIIFSLLAGLNHRYLLMLIFIGFSLGFFPFFNAYVDFLQKSNIIQNLSKTLKVLISKEFAYALLASSIFIFVTSFIISRFAKDRVRMIFGILILIFSLGFLAGNIAYNKLKPYQKNRLMVFFSPEIDRLGAGYNVIQSEIAVGSGGLFGKGFMKGSQNKLNILPERHTDFIFAVLAEEWGLVGSIIVLILFLILFFRLLWLISNSENQKTYLLLSGTTSIIFVNFTINMLMVLGLAPVTGLPLPFMSYGGSSIITNLALIGIVNNIYRERFILY
ncbi:MAG: rod shape-determining protein RodA [Brevinematales bacterium]|nr:rod shape-determining protein RodA [Brevinematales bacterium]